MGSTMRKMFYAALLAGAARDGHWFAILHR
jgi:hypothetical protein